MKIKHLHDWDLSPQAAADLQRRLATRVRIEAPRRKNWELIAGADGAIDKQNKQFIAGVVVLRVSDWSVIEQRVVKVPLTFPYVPGLLSFREAPGVLAAFAQIQTTPHAIICDAQGLAHPRGLGLACHLGLWLGLPTIGSAKSRLIGEADGPIGAKRGARRKLVHQRKHLGYVLRTRDKVKPLYISPGHRIDHDTSVELVLRCCTRYRLPEPQRLADQLVGRAKRGEAV